MSGQERRAPGLGLALALLALASASRADARLSWIRELAQVGPDGGPGPGQPFPGIAGEGLLRLVKGWSSLLRSSVGEITVQVLTSAPSRTRQDAPGFTPVPAPAPAPNSPNSLPSDSAVPPSPAAGPPPTPLPSPPALHSCPPQPSICQFYLDGHQNSVPSFSVVEGAGDVTLSPRIRGTLSSGSPADVISANSNQAQYVCVDGRTFASESTKEFTRGVSPDQQFYAVQDHVNARTFQAPDGAAPYQGKFVLLNLTSLELNIMGYTTNLNMGDFSTAVPQEKRCVVFKVS